MINEINKSLTSIEKAFNIAGSVPVAGIFSGILRAGAGKVQFVAGAIFATIGFVGKITRPDDAKWDRVARAGTEQMFHGTLNIMRGIGETLLAATIIGSFIPLIYSLNQESKFAPYYAYGSMQENMRAATV